MKLKIQILILLLGTVLSTFARARCTDLLKIQVLKKTGKPQILLFGEKAQEFYQRRNQVLLSKLLEYGNKVQILEQRQKNSSQKALIQAFREGKIPTEIQLPLFHLISDIIDPVVIYEWATDVYRDAIVEVYANKSFDASYDFDLLHTISEQLLIQVVLDRVSKAGFSKEKADIFHLKDSLLEDDFAKILRMKKLIIDDVSKGILHGHLMHLFQVDLILYIIKRNGHDPNLAGNLYQWMGIRKRHKLALMSFEPHMDVWDAFFDSDEKDLTSPEEINPILENYFNIIY